MMLSDVDIALVWPRYKGPMNPASVNLHLGDTLLVWPNDIVRDPRLDQRDRWKPVELSDGTWTLEPGIRYLGATQELLSLPNDIAGVVCARSSWGRDGLAVIQGPAGFVDPGWRGHLTLELSVVGSDLIVWPGAAVCQIVFHQLTSLVERPYGHPSRGSKYHGDLVPTPSRLHQEVAS